MIIENYIEWFTTDENERDLIKKDARLYVDEDWVDEIAQSNASINLKNVSEEELRRELELRGYYTQNLWCIDDVFRHHQCEVDDAQEVLDKVMSCESVCEHIFESINYYAEEVLNEK